MVGSRGCFEGSATLSRRTRSSPNSSELQLNDARSLPCHPRESEDPARRGAASGSEPRRRSRGPRFLDGDNIMRKIPSMISVSSAAFRANDAHNRALAKAFRDRQEEARHRRPRRDLDRLAKQGKMRPRERIEKLLDPGTPFLELSSL